MMKSTGFVQLVDSLQQAGKIHNLQVAFLVVYRRYGVSIQVPSEKRGPLENTLLLLCELHVLDYKFPTYHHHPVQIHPLLVHHAFRRFQLLHL